MRYTHKFPRSGQNHPIRRCRRDSLPCPLQPSQADQALIPDSMSVVYVFVWLVRRFGLIFGIGSHSTAQVSLQYQGDPPASASQVPKSPSVWGLSPWEPPGHCWGRGPTEAAKVSGYGTAPRVIPLWPLPPRVPSLSGSPTSPPSSHNLLGISRHAHSDVHSGVC